MLELSELKKSMTPDQISKVENAMAKLNTLTPEAKAQVLVGMDAMIDCELTKRKFDILKHEMNKKDRDQTSTNDRDLDYDLKKLKYLESVLDEKYVELKELSECIHDITDRESVCKSLERVLKLGTYSQGASAIILTSDIASLWLQHNLLKYHIKNYHNYEI
jgi:hypothetical protein